MAPVLLYTGSLNHTVGAMTAARSPDYANPGFRVDTQQGATDETECSRVNASEGRLGVRSHPAAQGRRLFRICKMA